MSSPFTPPVSRSSVSPLTRSAMSQVYVLLGGALLFTLLGVGLGSTVLLPFVTGPAMLLLFIVEIGLIFTSTLWSRVSPWNYLLFFAFPLISGLTLTPILLMYASQYVNGIGIITNALVATVLLTFASAVVSSMIRTDIWGTFGLFMMQALIGLILFGLVQLFFPSLRGPGSEMIVSSIGVVLFAVFLAADFQRLSRMGGMNPFMMAISIYLDIFNLFLYVLRFMGTLSGRNH